MNNLRAMVTVQITGADLAGTVQTLLKHGVMLYNLCEESDLRISFQTERQSMKLLSDICEKRGDDLKIKAKHGIIWHLFGIRKRPVFLLGLLCIVLVTELVGGRVLFIRVDGNVTIPDRRIMEAAESAGVCFGASRRALRSEQVKNTLLEVIPELKWACVNTVGCVANISVRERSMQEEKPGMNPVGRVVADRDGVILSCTATKGTLLCAVGQAVTAGETLISGYTDCGIYIQASQAEGEIFAQTLRTLRTVMPKVYSKKMQITEQAKNYSLIIGKKRINLWQSSGIPDTLCDRMYEEYYVTLPGGFVLPLAFSRETRRSRAVESAELHREDAQRLLKAFSASYLHRQMIAGEVLSCEENLIGYDSCYLLKGEYVCTEMIGRQQREQIGEYNGESN